MGCGNVENFTSQLRDERYQVGNLIIPKALTPCPPRIGMHLPYKLSSSFPAPPDLIYEGAGRHAYSQ
jgi:hypothetical protein